MFVFGDLNVHHKGWLTYSGGTDRSGELYYNFSVSNDLTLMANFPTWIPACSIAFISFFWLFPSIGEFWSCRCLSFHWLSIIFIMGCPVSSHCLWLFSCWMGLSSWSFGEMFHGRISLNSVPLQLLVNFVSGFSLELMYLSLIESVKWSLTHFLGFQLLVLLT